MPRLSNSCNVRRAKEPASSAAASGWPKLRRDDLQRGFGFCLIVGVVRERLAHDQQARPDRPPPGRCSPAQSPRLVLFFMMREFGIGEVVLVLVTGPWVGGLGGRPRGVRPVWRAFVLPLLHFRIVLCLLQRVTLFGPRFQHRFGFCQPRQRGPARGDFVTDHQPIGQVACSARSLRANRSSTSARSCASSSSRRL